MARLIVMGKPTAGTAALLRAVRRGGIVQVHPAVVRGRIVHDKLGPGELRARLVPGKEHNE